MIADRLSIVFLAVFFLFAISVEADEPSELMLDDDESGEQDGE
jgi:hypothetical protein